MVGFVGGAAIILILSGGALWLLLGPQLISSGAPPTVAPEVRGEALYVATCQSCHGGPTGGAITDYPPRHNANGHTWHHPDCALVRIIRDGGNQTPESIGDIVVPSDAPLMPGFKDRLSGDEITAVLRFIKTMWTAQQRSVQAEISREMCVPSS